MKVSAALHNYKSQKYKVEVQDTNREEGCVRAWACSCFVFYPYRLMLWHERLRRGWTQFSRAAKEQSDSRRCWETLQPASVRASSRDRHQICRGLRQRSHCVCCVLSKSKAGVLRSRKGEDTDKVYQGLCQRVLQVGERERERERESASVFLWTTDVVELQVVKARDWWGLGLEGYHW